MAALAGHGASAIKWLGVKASQAHVAAQQTGMDLLQYLDLPMAAGWIRVCLPVTPPGAARHLD